MPTFIFDTVEGASLEIVPGSARNIRTGFVKGIDLANTPDSEALIKVYESVGFPAMNSAISANYPSIVLKRVRVFPYDMRDPNNVRVGLEYRYDREQYTPTAFLVRDDSYANQSVTPRIPGTSNTMSIGFTPTGESDETQSIRPDIVTLNIFKPARAISVSALRIGRPAGGYQDKMCYVNDAPWPSGSVVVGSATFDNAYGPNSNVSSENAATTKPKGYWLLSRYATEHNVYRGYHTVQATAITRVVEDWSEIVVMRNAQGKAPYGGIGRAAQTAIETSIEAQAYKHGQIWPVNDSVDNMEGIARVGPYPITNFASLFGF